MKQLRANLFISFLFLCLTIFSQAQTPTQLRHAFQNSPSPAGTTPYGANAKAGHYVNAGDAKIYYEVYGEGKPLVLLHGAFYTIDMNWGQLIPELSKTRKVIALEMQGHGHTPFSSRE